MSHLYYSLGLFFIQNTVYRIIIAFDFNYFLKKNSLLRIIYQSLLRLLINSIIIFSIYSPKIYTKSEKKTDIISIFVLNIIDIFDNILY